MIRPRDYQQQAIASIIDMLHKNRSTLAVLPTGAGKMVIAAFVIDHFRKFGDVLFLAHRGELLEQAQAKINAVSGVWPALEKAQHYADLHTVPHDGEGRVIVSSIQTQVSGTNGWRRRNRFKPEQFSLVVIDECHRGHSNSYINTFTHYRQNHELKIVGFTATPNRTDKKALGQIFETVAFDYPPFDCMNDGWLVPPKVLYTTIHGMDLSKVKTTAGDLNAGDLAKVMEMAKPLNDVAKATIDGCGDRKTIVFTVSVDQAAMLTEIINNHKPESARHVTGKTDEFTRSNIMHDFRHGAFQYLVNVGVLTEGVDIPTVSAVVMARPTKSALVFAQQIGRALRPQDGLVDRYPTPDERKAAIAASAKPDALIIDLVGNSGRHKLIRATDILGGRYTDEVRALAERKMQSANAPKDVVEALEQAKAEITDREREVARRLAENRARAKTTSREVDPYSYDDMHAPIWSKHVAVIPPSEAQIRLALSHGVDVSKLSKKQASGVIGKIMNQKGGRPATVKQKSWLIWKRHWREGMTFEQASKAITEIKGEERADI